jgi:hypothetical protein
MNSTTSLVWGILLGAGLWPADATAGAQSPAVAQPEQMAKLLAEAKPHLEALGIRPSAWPRLRVVGSTEFSACPNPNLEARLAATIKDLRSADKQRVLETTRMSCAKAMVAQLCEGTGTILVCPTNMPSIARSDAALARVNSAGFLQLALVRETVCYYLEQRYHLAQLRSGCSDVDARQALEAVIEGRVRQVTHQIAGRMKLDAYSVLQESSMHLFINAEFGDSFFVQFMAGKAEQQRIRAGEQGAAFWDYVLSQGLREAQVFAVPPRQVSRVARADLYIRALRAHRRSLSDVVEGLGTALPAAEWRAAQQPFSPDMVRQVAEFLSDRGCAEKYLASWDEGRSLVWTNRMDPARQVALSVVRFENATAARAYFGFALDLQRKRDTLSGGSCTPTIRVLDSRTTDLSLPHAEQAVRSDKRLALGPGGAPVPTSTLLVRAADVVVECTWNGLPGDIAWGERLLAAFLPAKAP